MLPRYGFSRALLLTARGVLPEAEQECLFTGFQQADALGATAEWQVQRADGASFNPRPSRICQLLMIECRERSLSNLLCAAFSCAPAASLELQVRKNEAAVESAAYTQELKQALSIAIKAQQPSVEEAPVVPESEACTLLVHGLDTLRHLHMSSLSKTQREQQIDKWQRIHAALAVYPSVRRISDMVENCLRRYRKDS